MADRQLNLFKGKRQKGELPPTPLELALHIPLVKAIRLSLMAGWSFTHFGNGGLRDKRTAALFKAMGLTPGFPDLVFFGPAERVFFLELKRRGGRLSAEQEDVRYRLMASGFDYLMTDDLEDALDMLRLRGIVRARVSA